MSALSLLPHSASRIEETFEQLQARYEKAKSNDDKNKAKRLTADFRCFSIFIGYWLRTQGPQGLAKADDLLYQLELRNIVDISTSNMMMNTFLSQGDAIRASELMKRMDNYCRSQGRILTPTTYTFSAVLGMTTESAHSSSMEVEQLLRERESASVRDSSIQVSGYSYNFVIKKMYPLAKRDGRISQYKLWIKMIQRHKMLGEVEIPAKQILIAVNRNSGGDEVAIGAKKFVQSTRVKLAQIDVDLDSYL